MGVITDPKQIATYSSPDQIAEVVYEAATDGKAQLPYIAGADAKAMYAMRLQLGDEAFRKAIAQQFFEDAKRVAWLSHSRRLCRLLYYNRSHEPRLADDCLFASGHHRPMVDIL